jgi:2-hydroxychromene-2-carboxylate isomerase
LNPPTIDYYFCPQSPFVYLGHARFVALIGRTGAAVRLKPCDIPRIFSVSGGLPLAQRPIQRQSYRLLELKRFSAALGRPLNPHPKFFPVSGDPGARLVLATLAAHGAALALDLVGALGAAVWAEELDIADPGCLAAVTSRLGLDGAALVEASKAPAIEAAYQKMTDEAIAAEVFGAPTYVLNGERFWGQDRLDLLENALLRGGQ